MYELYTGPVLDPRARYFFPVVIITSLGEIQFNNGTTKDLAKNGISPSFGCIQCFHNPNTNRIGFRFCKNNRIEGGHMVFGRKTCYNCINARAFLKKSGYLPNTKEAYRIEYDKENDLYEVVKY